MLHTTKPHIVTYGVDGDAMTLVFYPDTGCLRFAMRAALPRAPAAVFLVHDVFRMARCALWLCVAIQFLPVSFVQHGERLNELCEVGYGDYRARTKRLGRRTRGDFPAFDARTGSRVRRHA
ncbi:protein of unknown function [Paraburkholderia dioscoreae]|uniref:Uncharacterized protein n=1 Tax=Paraburkholderia dioscoreae TaxID=2604047 RepID=A0A5Q4ZQ25_9BURK|nr:protein of unknown function [Paraburkholderia dioscoreae]